MARPQVRTKVLTVTGHTPVDNVEAMRTKKAKRGTMSVTGSTPQRQLVHNNTTRETYSVDDARAAMGIDWMPMRALSQAIPPAYSEWIGRQAIAYLETRQ